MRKLVFLTLILILLTSLFITSCGGSDKTTTAVQTTKPPTATTTKAPPPATTTKSGPVYGAPSSGSTMEASHK